MKRCHLSHVAPLLCLILVAGCAAMQSSAPTGKDAAGEMQRPEERPATLGTGTVPVLASTVDEFDTTTAAERRAASATPAGAERDLGVTVASLGSPSEPGFWLKTPLVSSPATGRVLYAGTGKSATVELVPLDGPSTAGSRMSLAAMRLIGAPLTGLPEVRVFRTGG